MTPAVRTRPWSMIAVDKHGPVKSAGVMVTELHDFPYAPSWFVGWLETCFRWLVHHWLVCWFSCVLLLFVAIYHSRAVNLPTKSW